MHATGMNANRDFYHNLIMMTQLPWYQPPTVIYTGALAQTLFLKLLWLC